MQDCEDLQWKFNAKNIVKYTFSDKMKTNYTNYQGRVDFSEDNYSLLLKNLTKSDSGLYRAIVERDSEDVAVAQYNVNVEDAVTPADQAGAPVSSTSSPDSCYLTVWTLLMGNLIVFLFPF